MWGWHIAHSCPCVNSSSNCSPYIILHLLVFIIAQQVTLPSEAISSLSVLKFKMEKPNLQDENSMTAESKKFQEEEERVAKVALRTAKLLLKLHRERSSGVKSTEDASSSKETDKITTKATPEGSGITNDTEPTTEVSGVTKKKDGNPEASGVKEASLA